MKVLGIDSSGLVASVAVVEEDKLTAEFTVNDKKTHSQTLLPMLEQVKEQIGLELDGIDVIAVAAGPGSFTGLRIGSATAKGLGLALQKPLAAVPTVDALAYNLWGSQALICPLMDARRNQVYTGIYSFEPGKGDDGFVVLTEQTAADIGEIAERLNLLSEQKDKPVIFLGDGVQVYQERLKQLMRVPYSFAPAHVNKQRAAAVAALGLVYAKAGRLQSADEHQPEYLRLSQAERERLEQEAARRENN